MRKQGPWSKIYTQRIQERMAALAHVLEVAQQENFPLIERNTTLMEHESKLVAAMQNLTRAIHEGGPITYHNL